MSNTLNMQRLFVPRECIDSQKPRWVLCLLVTDYIHTEKSDKVTFMQGGENKKGV